MIVFLPFRQLQIPKKIFKKSLVENLGAWAVKLNFKMHQPVVMQVGWAVARTAGRKAKSWSQQLKWNYLLSLSQVFLSKLSNSGMSNQVLN